MASGPVLSRSWPRRAPVRIMRRVSDTGDLAALAEPPTRAAVRDIVAVAEPILAVYRRGVHFYDGLSEVGDSTQVQLVFSCEASSVRAAATLLGTLQLAVDAATAAVEYVEQAEYYGGEINSSLLERLAATPLFELEIVELANGSIKGRLKFLRTRDGRGKLLNVALIVSIVLSGVITVIPSLVITVLYAANELTPDERDAEIRRLEEDLTELQQDFARQVAIDGELRNRSERLEQIGGIQAVRNTEVVIELEIAA
jgi:hypothetical protein